MNITHPPSENELQILFQEAYTLQEKNRLEEAEKKYLELLSYASDIWLVHFNLGLLYFTLCRFEDSIEHYGRALSLAGPVPDIHFNLAICLKQCGRYKEAIDSYNSALQLDPDDLDCLYNLAGCHLASGNHSEASLCYNLLLSKKHDHEPALNNLAYLYHKNGDMDKAIDCYTRLVEINPSHQSAVHMCNALQGTSSTTAPSSYIRDVFDQYSDHYEDSLVNKLEYKLPGVLLDFSIACSGSETFGAVIDLGCGTGLSGEAFVNSCSLIDGVDISENMLSIAEGKGIYRHLWKAEIIALLSSHLPEKYALVLAADVFSYFGELDTVFNLAAGITDAGGLFCFSVEVLENSDTNTYSLQESGRFAHSDNYIRNSADNNGWRFINSNALNLRKERGCWIKGMLYGFRLKDFS